MTSISLIDVSKHYGSVRAVDGVSLDVKQGEFATILGPSGSGKTTLLSMIAGITAPTGGQIRIGSRDVTWLPAAERNVGLVFQSYALFPHMSVFGNVAFPLSIRNVPRAEIQRRVNEALELVRLQPYAERRPAALSGGQQQRVALARAIVFNPDILLLDEPLAALDRKLREEVRHDIRQLQRKLGITTVLVTHDQDEALSLSDRIIVVSGGKVEQIDTPEIAYNQPRSRFVADFLGVANFLEGEMQAGGGESGIRLDSGELVPCAHAPSRASRKICGVLRPEQIALSNGPAPVGLLARVTESVFFGDSVRYVVALESGRTLVAHVNEPRIKHREGTVVSLHWEPGSVWVLPE